MKVLIVGNGIAGNEVAFGLRKINKNMEITILSAENFPEYDPSSLPYFVSGEVQKDVVFRKNLGDYKRNNIKLTSDNEAIYIDPDIKKVKTKNGDEFLYDKLILAHGGALFIPPIDGIEKRSIFNCKRFAEAEKLSKHRGTKAVIIGSGAVGIETAEALKKKGYEVTIVELLDWILPSFFCESTSKRLEITFKNYGVNIFTKERVLSIKGSERVESVETNKRNIPCDTVIIATGVTPGKALAQTAGIRVGRGIKVNEMMETSVKDIFACGDCAETFDALSGEECVYQLKHNAIEEARVVVRNILGKKAVFKGSYIFARANFFSTHAITFGKTFSEASRLFNPNSLDVLEKDSDDNYLRLILKEGKIIGGQAIGNFADYSGIFMGAMWRGDNINNLRKEWENIIRIDSKYPWLYRKMVEIIGSNFFDNRNKDFYLYSIINREVFR